MEHQPGVGGVVVGTTTTVRSASAGPISATTLVVVRDGQEAAAKPLRARR